MNVLSCFDGISCGMVALERAGIKVDNYYASEINKYAIQISRKNYPNIHQLGDINNWKSWNLPKIDLLIGGSPCQGFSRAGLELNFLDERSKLFFTFVDILKFYKPKYFLLENVRMRKEWVDIISKYMGVEPVLINSKLVSAQNRDRYYWANFDITLPEDREIFIKDILEDNATPIILHNLYGGFGETKPRVFTTKSPTIRTSAGGGHIPNVVVGNSHRKLTPVECERLQTLPDNYTKVDGISNTQRYNAIGNGWTIDVITHIFKGLLKEASWMKIIA